MSFKSSINRSWHFIIVREHHEQYLLPRILTYGQVNYSQSESELSPH